MKTIYWGGLILLILMLLNYNLSFASTYYVKLTGSDNLDGLSIATAWKTLDQVNLKNFLPGDRIMFEGGSTFNGIIYLDQGDKGDPANPIIITSFGTGRAIINSGNNFGCYVYNTSGIKILNINFKGSGPAVNNENGIKFFTDIPNTRLEYIFMDNVEVSGYSKSGILISSLGYDRGFKNVTVTNCNVHDNGETGIRSFGDSLNLTKVFAHQNVYVANNKVYNTTGQSSLIWFHTGSAIVLHSVNNAVIEYNETYNNGSLNSSPQGGPVGIWVFNANNVTIQYNESHHNKAGFDRDGGGFDLDGGTTNSVMQCNYSHDNEGAGYMVAQFKNAQPLKGNIIRYNISQNDGRKNNYPGILLWSSGSNGGIQDLNIYNNTIYITPPTTGNPKAVYIDGPMSGIQFRNNIIYTTSWVYAIVSTRNDGIVFQGNDFYSSGTFNIWWAGNTYGSMSAWSTATGQEKNGTISTGMQIDPQLTAAGGGNTISNMSKLNTLSAYKLKSTSPLINKGLALSQFGVNAGTRDYYGYTLPQNSGYEIGAHEFAVSPTNTAITVDLTSPLNNSTFSKGSTIILSANAASGDATIARVEFYQGSALIGTSTAWPFQSTWTNINSGTYTLTARAYNSTGISQTSSPVSITVSTVVVTTTLRTPENPANAINGLDYSYYEGTWPSLPDFNSLTPVKTGKVNSFDITGRNRNDYFGFKYSGYVSVPADGTYTFYTNSNDGSKLYIGSTEVVVNDGMHAATEKSGTIGLKAGKHAVKVIYFDNAGSEFLSASYAGPGITKQLIPSSSLYRISEGTQVCTSTGNISREVWNGISGDNILSLTSNANYPNSPSSVSTVSIFEGPANAADNYGARYRGYFCAPETGSYTFWIASDNNSELWLSTDAAPANKRKIAFLEGYTDSREWLKFPTQKSLPIDLVKGIRYYVEALHKEGSGGDNFAVGWQLPSGILERPIPGTRLSPYSSTAMRLAEETDNDSLDNMVRIFPNPTSDLLWVKIMRGELQEMNEINILIFDMAGRVFNSSTWYLSRGTDMVELDLSDVPKGIYNVSVNYGDNKNQSKKIIVAP